MGTTSARLCALSAALLVAHAAVVAGSATAAAQAPPQSTGWAEKMFSATSHDFGVVARGADIRTRLTVTNLYKEDVHIANVRTSCGCSSAGMPAKTLLKTRESTEIEVSMDTRRFTRHKDSNVIVTFDAPYPAEVTIPVKMYVRTDVVLTPGGVNFGVVDLGQPAVQTVDIAYAGHRRDWSIRDVETAGRHLTAEVAEVSRTVGADGIFYVNYKLTAHLQSDAPAGNLREEIRLLTDDVNNPTVPVLVDARVEADVTVTPDTVPLGTLTPGKKKTVNVVIRGKKPFAVESIECESSDEAFAVRLPTGTRQVHVLPLEFTAPAKPGLYTETFTVTIPGRAEPVVFKATARIAEGT